MLYVAEVPIFKKEPRIVSEGGPTSLRDYALELAQAELIAFLKPLDPEQRARLFAKVDAGSPRA